jgi:hypothetical protein
MNVNVTTMKTELDQSCQWAKMHRQQKQIIKKEHASFVEILAL